MSEEATGSASAAAADERVTASASPPLRNDETIAARLARAERARDDRLRRDPATDDDLSSKARKLRHLVHLTPGQSILEIGAGDQRFARQLRRVSRAENSIAAATFRVECHIEPEIGVERIALQDWPGRLIGRSFDCIVGVNLIDCGVPATLLAEIYALLAPSGQLVLFEENFWNPARGLKNAILSLPGKQRRGGTPSRSTLYELASDIGFVRILAAYSNARPSRRTTAQSSASLVAENMTLVNLFSREIVFFAQKPPRALIRPCRSLCEHDALKGSVSVVIPCHNEEMNIGPLIERLLELYGDYLQEIVPVENNSSDSTAAVIARYAAADPRIRPIYQTGSGGVGGAIAEGVRAARGQWILSMDCDFQHLLTEVRDMFDLAATGAPVVYGSRFAPGSVLLNYPVSKILCNRAFHLLTGLSLGRPFRDLTNNLKLIRRDVFQQMEFTQTGFAINAEIGIQPVLMGYPVAEAEMSWINRSFDMGVSSFDLVRVGRAYAVVLWNAYRARVFGSGPYRRLVAAARRGPNEF